MDEYKRDELGRFATTDSRGEGKKRLSKDDFAVSRGRDQAISDEDFDFFDDWSKRTSVPESKWGYFPIYAPSFRKKKGQPLTDKEIEGMIERIYSEHSAAWEAEKRFAAFEKKNKEAYELNDYLTGRLGLSSSPEDVARDEGICDCDFALVTAGMPTRYSFDEGMERNAEKVNEAISAGLGKDNAEYVERSVWDDFIGGKASAKDVVDKANEMKEKLSHENVSKIRLQRQKGIMERVNQKKMSQFLTRFDIENSGMRSAQRTNDIKTSVGGYSESAGKSRRALIAEDEGRYPLSVASKMLGVPQKQIKEELSDGEWHHSGGTMYNKVSYYDVGKVYDAVTDMLDGYPVSRRMAEMVERMFSTKGKE